MSLFDQNNLLKTSTDPWKTRYNPCTAYLYADLVIFLRCSKNVHKKQTLKRGTHLLSVGSVLENACLIS